MMNQLIDKYWEHYVNHKNDKIVCNPSIPIIWFGDLDAYLRSEKKIVSISLNPSKSEFDIDVNNGNTKRFPNISTIYNKNVLKYCDKHILIDELNNYFKVEPYSNWFDKIENKVLQWLDASYNVDKANNEDNYNKALHTAIHVDFIPALASDPVYGQLSTSQKWEINNVKLSIELLKELNPDVILCSFSYKLFILLMSICYDLRKSDLIGSITDKNFKIELYIRDGKSFIFGSNMKGTPFAMDDSKIESFIKKYKPII